MSVALGTTLGPWTVDAVSADHMVTLARVLADPNPIHLDAGAVQALGMGDRQINQGPANMSYVLNLLCEAFPGGALRSFEVRFLANVHAGDRVSATGTVDAMEERDGAREVRCSIALEVDGEGRALDGTAVVVLPQDGPGPS
ncbi:MAG: dehydratase [Conexibacter sp.]|nr:dehydratase [Conexibacter sp.]